MAALRGWLLLFIVLAILVGGVVAVRKLSETEAARLAKLRPEVRDAVQRIRAELAREGIETFVGSTRRDEVEQAAKVAAGLSDTKSSWHLLGRGIELYVGTPDGKNKDGTPKIVADVKGKNIAGYRRMHEVAKRHGGRGIPNGQPFDAKGNPAHITTSSGKVWDVAHLEFSGGLTFAQAQAADTRKVA